MRIRRIRLSAGRTKPIAVRTNGIRCMVCFAHRTCPVMIATGIFFNDGGTVRTINASAIAIHVVSEIFLTGRAIPIMIAGDIIFGIICGGTVGAIPVIVGATVGERMGNRMTRTIPGVIAVRLFGCVMADLFIGTIPVMFATDRRCILPLTVGTIPIAVRAVGTRGVMSVAVRTPSIMGATCFTRQNRITVGTETTAVIAISIKREHLPAGRAIPEMIAMRIRRIRLTTGCAEPTVVRTGSADGMVRFAGGACPIMVTMLVLLQNRTAFTAIKTFFRADFIRRMTFSADTAVPGIITGLTDFFYRLAGRTVPAVRFRSGTNKVRRMMFAAGFAVPEVRADFGLAEHPAAFGTVTTIFRTGRV